MTYAKESLLGLHISNRFIRDYLGTGGFLFCSVFVFVFSKRGRYSRIDLLSILVRP